MKGKVFTFEEHDTFLFGRHRTCHAQLPRDGYVSRHHFLLEVNPPDARIRDLGSRSGTHVNGVKFGGRELDEQPEDVTGREFAEVDLRDGDVIKVGETEIRVSAVLPFICNQCGAELPEHETVAPDWTHGTYLCSLCRGNQATLVLREQARSPSCCNQCGRDVTAELGERRSGTYICHECQSSLKSKEFRGLLSDSLKGRPSLGGYVLGEELGRGGMGSVFRATRKEDGATVALKVMLARIAVDQAGRDRFQREISVMQELRHQHITQLLDKGSEGSTFYFVAEYCNGGNVEQLRSKRGGMLPAQLAVRITLQCLSALDYAHNQGYVHRDIKPENILLHRRNSTWVTKMSDFGLAKSFDRAGFSGMTATGTAGGTFHFMPREQLIDFKYVKPVSDLWSLAATCYHLLTGAYPRDCPSGKDPMRVILNDDAVPIREQSQTVPADLANLIDRALLTDIDKRFSSAHEMRTGLHEVLAALA